MKKTTSKVSVPLEYTITTTPVLVECPKCKSNYYIDEKQLGVIKPCPICKEEVTPKRDDTKSTKS